MIGSHMWIHSDSLKDYKLDGVFHNCTPFSVPLAYSWTFFWLLCLGSMEKKESGLFFIPTMASTVGTERSITCKTKAIKR